MAHPVPTIDKEALRPQHIVAGLGGAQRELMATCLALFDDSTISSHIGRIYEDTKNRVIKRTDAELKEAAENVRRSQQRWLQSTLTDDHFRVALWIQLRTALRTPARLSTSYIGAEKLADDLSARVVALLAPPRLVVQVSKDWLSEHGLIERSQDSSDDEPVNLHSVVEPVLRDLLQAALSGKAGKDVADTVLEQAVSEMEALGPEERDRIREELGVDDISEAALAKVLATGSGLALFSSIVSMAGFSAYILAAQASAFIPLVSGPGLVSFVSVMSNPVTLVAGTVGAGWWLSSSANQRIRAIVATRAVAMLAIQGLSSGRKGLDEALKAFASIDSLPTNAGSRLDRKQISQYQNEWILLKAHARSAHKVPSAGWGFFDRRVVQRPPSNREGEERLNAAAYGAMTVGDVLYHAAQISPEVIAAADFSYLADIDGSLDFALLAAGMGDGAVVRLKGYVAEQIVAAKLQAAGHVVTFADSASEPGWDLRVDGQPVQVKFHDSVEGIREHFSEYSYPVFANTELAGSVPDEFVDRVFFIDGVSNDLVTSITQLSVEAGQDATDPDVALMAFAISAFRSARALHQGHLTRAQAVEQVLTDGAVRIGLAATGSMAGAGVGLFLFGPAGAWVLGAGLPILAQSQTGRVVGQLKASTSLPEYRRWAESAHELLDSLQATGINALRSRKDQLEGLINTMTSGFALGKSSDFGTAKSVTFLRLAGLLPSPTGPPGSGKVRYRPFVDSAAEKTACVSSTFEESDRSLPLLIIDWS
jgi:hypothetical protein